MKISIICDDPFDIAVEGAKFKPNLKNFLAILSGTLKIFK